MDAWTRSPHMSITPAFPSPILSPPAKQGTPPCIHALACAYLVSFGTSWATWVPLRAEAVPGASHYREIYSSPSPSRTLGLAPHHWPGRRRVSEERRGKQYSPGSQEVLYQGAQVGQVARALLPAPQARQSQGLPGQGLCACERAAASAQHHSPPHRHPQLTFCPLGPMTQISPGRPCGWV